MPDYIEYVKTDPSPAYAGEPYTIKAGLYSPDYYGTGIAWWLRYIGENADGEVIWKRDQKISDGWEAGRRFEASMDGNIDETLRTVKIWLVIINAQHPEEEWVADTDIINLKKKAKDPITKFLEELRAILPASISTGPPLPRFMRICWKHRSPTWARKLVGR